MHIASDVLTALVALLHVYFLVLEMFLWTKPFGLKTFGQTLQKAEDSKVLAANQGLYNGFLAAGLFWSLGSHGSELEASTRAFFLGCVVVAGVYGGMTVNKRIAMIQAVPALLAAGLFFAARM